jgi:hypothetical protein
VKKLVALSAVVAAFGIVAACSQGDTHPPLIADCDGCGQPPVSTGGEGGADGSKSDGSTDASTQDATAKDATGNDSSANDASTNDAGTNDGSLLDSGLLD